MGGGLLTNEWNRAAAAVMAKKLWEIVVVVAKFITKLKRRVV